MIFVFCLVRIADSYTLFDKELIAMIGLIFSYISAATFPPQSLTLVFFFCNLMFYLRKQNEYLRYVQIAFVALPGI
jgi:hypothetical protein